MRYLQKHCQRHNGPEGWVDSISQVPHKSWQNFNFGISIKHWLQNLNQNNSISTKLKLKILTKPSFIILTKIQLRNLNQTSAANLRILTKPCAQSLNKSLALCPNLSFQICNKLLPTRASSSTSATPVTTSTSFELASLHARVPSIKFTKHYGVSQLVSQWVS